MISIQKLLWLLNILVYFLLALFSYSYVDLNLTLSQNPIVVNLVGKFQQLGYFNRSAATLIYLIITTFSFSLFILNLYLFYKKRLKLNFLVVSAVSITIILIFSYPFLSHDLFNYLFDAKIILNYHASPYTHKPLDFPNDEWLRFMHWVHRYSPYGPLWLLYSLIPAAFGFGKFILNFLTFKIFIGIFHLVNSYLIFKILGKINKKRQLVGTAFYSLNPILLVEGVTNAHNDVVLASFLLLPVYFLTQGKTVWSFITNITGVLIKYITILNLPWLIWHIYKRQNLTRFIYLNLVTMALFTYLYSSFKIVAPFVSPGSTQVQFQPWYLFWTLPLIALIPGTLLIVLSIAISVGAALRYLPLLYFGDWSHPATNNYMQIVTVVPLLISALFVLIIRVVRSSK